MATPIPNKKPFDPERNIDHTIRRIREELGGTTAIIGISGGKDSTIAAALLTKALGPERVLGVLMPDGKQADLHDARRVASILGIRHTIANIKGITQAFRHTLETLRIWGEGPIAFPEDTFVNMPPRMRMAMLYAIAPSQPGGGRVINTCNASEDHIGYSTKNGDAAGDFSLFADYTVTEILAMGRVLAGQGVIPLDLVEKAPSDGLCGKTDEDRFGFTYAVLDRYVRTGICDDPATKEKIDRMHRLNLHKVTPMPYIKRLQ